MRVGVIDPVGGHGGMDYYDEGLCQGLVRADVEVTLFTGVGDERTLRQFEVDRCFAGVFVPARSIVHRVEQYLRGLIHTFVALRKKRAVLAHLQWFHIGPLEILSVLGSRLAGLRIVVTLHDIHPLGSGVGGHREWFSGLAARLVDCWIVHNENSRRELVESFGRGIDNVFVIPHGNYKPAEHAPSKCVSRLALSLPPKEPVLLFFGQIKEVKGLDLLLDALARLQLTGSPMHLVIAGKPWKCDFLRYQDQICRLGIEDRCHLHLGYVSNRRVPMFFAAADAIVLPYRRGYESGVALMAMSYGLPVIASDIPSMKETIENESTGTLFRSGDSGDLCDAVRNALANRSRLNAMANCARERMESERSWAFIGGRTKEVYGRALGCG